MFSYFWCLLAQYLPDSPGRSCPSHTQHSPICHFIFSQMLELGNIDNIEPLSNSYLVELGVVAPYGQDAIQEDMRNFAEQLKPYPCLTSF